MTCYFPESFYFIEGTSQITCKILSPVIQTTLRRRRRRRWTKVVEKDGKVRREEKTVWVPSCLLDGRRKGIFIRVEKRGIKEIEPVLLWWCQYHWLRRTPGVSLTLHGFYKEKVVSGVRGRRGYPIPPSTVPRFPCSGRRESSLYVT